MGTQAFAQNVKIDNMAFSLTVQQQASVSTSAAANAGDFSQSPTHYSTQTFKMTQTDLLKAIAYVLHNKNANFYTIQAKLQLVQGELGGFWNIDDGLAQSYRDYNSDGSLEGSYNEDGNDTSTYYSSGMVNGNGWTVADTWEEFFPLGYENDLATYLDSYDRTSIADGTDEYARLDTGRHFLTVPYDVNADSDYATTGEYPPGHMQPWGQIYVKDPGHKDTSGNPLCENVTFFFYLAVQECYDCFYLNSFISDAIFTTKQGAQVGPPCCTSPVFLLGKGVDKYYLTLAFDNTINNSYLNPALVTNDNETVTYYYEYTGFTGLVPSTGGADGTTPDLLVYSDPIRSHVGLFNPYETRFTLNGILTYNWTLKMVNTSDAAADFVGTGTYNANGFGFIKLACSLITGTASFAESIVKDTGCCDDVFWWDDEYNDVTYNGQGDYYTWVTGWFGPGSGVDWGYFNPDYDQFNPYPYYNICGGYAYEPEYYTPDGLPYQNETPVNPQAALTYHTLYDITAFNHGEE